MISKIIIEGVDYSGKKSLYQKIKNKIENIEIQIDGILKEQYELHWSKWDKSKNDKNTLIILLEATPEKLLERAELKDNNNQNYISPFPVPGYSLSENLWEFVCDLNEKDPLDDRLDKEIEKNDNQSYTGIKHLMKKKRNTIKK